MSESRKSSNGLLIALIVVMVAILCVLIILAVCMRNELPQTPKQTTAATTSEATTEVTTEATTQPTEPPMKKEATATIGATGDVLMHMPIVNSCYDRATGTYDFNPIFQSFAPYISGVDYAVANLETTLCGTDNGYQYSGYPCFNCPDDIVDALKQTGFDLLLTANNHSYDTGSVGFTRTQQVIAETGLPHIGTRPTAEDKNYIVVDVNGIQIGMINYTYNTDSTPSGSVALNGIPLSAADSKLINSFNNNQLDAFYTKLEGEIEAMRNDGAEAIVLYIHWGNEYQTTENSYQNTVAQGVCNLGVDVIVGNHPHVPQPVELLTNQNDESKKTLCLYSTGNAISNQNRNANPTVHVEDGMLFTFTFAKYSDGTVLLEGARVIPTWVDRNSGENGAQKYLIRVMDDTVEDWQTAFELTDSKLKFCQESYDRTMKIVGEGMTQANEYYTANQDAVEVALGIKEAPVVEETVDVEEYLDMEETPDAA